MENIKKKTIYFPIEIYYREFFQRLYLISKLIKKNYRAYIGTKAGIDKILNNKLDNNSFGGIFFYKGIIIQNKNYWNKISKCCDNFIALDEELGPSVPDKDLSLKIRGVFDKRISKFFVIGKIWKKKILGKDKRFKNIAINTGWPKYDLIKDNNFNFYNEEASKIKKKHGDFYLFSSNYGTLSKNGLKQMSLILNKNYSRKFCEKKNKIFNQNYEDFKIFIEQLKTYYRNNGKSKIVIRPHPSEFFHIDWINNTKKISNKIKIIYEGDMIPWILASKGLIHRGCGTSVDAYILKKKAYYLKPDRKMIAHEKNITYDLSYKIESLKDIHSLKNKNKLNLKKINFEIENFKRKKSFNSILRELKKLKTIKVLPIKKEIYKNKSYSFINSVRYFTNIFFKKKNSQKMPHKLTKKIIINFYRNLKCFKKININKINKETFEIELKK